MPKPKLILYPAPNQDLGTSSITGFCFGNKIGLWSKAIGLRTVTVARQPTDVHDVHFGQGRERSSCNGGVDSKTGRTPQNCAGDGSFRGMDEHCVGHLLSRAHMYGSLRDAPPGGSQSVVERFTPMEAAPTNKGRPGKQGSNPTGKGSSIIVGKAIGCARVQRWYLEGCNHQGSHSRRLDNLFANANVRRQFLWCSNSAPFLSEGSHIIRGLFDRSSRRSLGSPAWIALHPCLPSTKTHWRLLSKNGLPFLGTELSG